MTVAASATASAAAAAAAAAAFSAALAATRARALAADAAALAAAAVLELVELRTEGRSACGGHRHLHVLAAPDIDDARSVHIAQHAHKNAPLDQAEFKLVGREKGDAELFCKERLRLGQL